MGIILSKTKEGSHITCFERNSHFANTLFEDCSKYTILQIMAIDTNTFLAELIEKKHWS